MAPRELGTLVHTLAAIGHDRSLEVDIMHLFARVALHLVRDIHEISVAVGPTAVLTVRSMLWTSTVGDRLLLLAVVTDQLA
ncbi:hypothetical protein [Halostagnicola kamekurae]|uniref:Uncharacterized protein n=1 Tax=Halostagnicola kamekurae TaxID=619731 RepID=A0A1I6RGE0_9EURY|nr:hypothetical protein [Halostagnicola kamekurae]SFS63650.1 hypothetical protein SAMN04488556_1769 [Halostagnicola kamekurae]